MASHFDILVPDATHEDAPVSIAPYFVQAMETAKHHCDIRMLHELAVAYKEVGTFRPERFPQSIVHGDPTQSNCLFDKDMFVAWIDWEEVGVGASLLDLALSIVSFCHCYQGPTLAVWKPEWSAHFLAGCRRVCAFSCDEEDHLEAAIKYAVLVVSVWSLLQFGVYYPDPVLLDGWLHPLLIKK